MILPDMDDPQRFRGLYVFDFGEWIAVGYTAEEVQILLEQERYRECKVYKIHRASPDGQMELRGIAPQRFGSESGIFFYRSELEAARTDFEALRTAAEKISPPCRAFVQLADRAVKGPSRFVTALIFPAEYEDEISSWLTAIAYRGGELAEGGISQVTNYYQQEKTVLDRQQLWSRSAIPSRSAEEVLASVRRAVQR